MPRTLRVSKTVTLLNENRNYAIQTDIVADNLTEANPTVTAAKVGQLTTRTSASVGTLTMNSGHGFNTADIIDLFWPTGKRVGVVVGTVATNSVPISGGSGDDLPDNLTAITAMKRHAEDRVFDGDDAQWIMLNSPVAGWVTFTQTDGTTVIVSIPLTADDSGNNYTYEWNIEQNPGDNPLVGGAVGKILFSHGSTSDRDMRAIIGTN